MKPISLSHRGVFTVLEKGTDRIEFAGTQVSVTRLGVTDARDGMPSLIKQAAGGTVFVIQNAKSSAAPEVMLVAPEVLERVLMAPRRRRTLAELIDSLPLRRVSGAAPRAALPDDVAPDLVAPGSFRKAPA